MDGQVAKSLEPPRISDRRGDLGCRYGLRGFGLRACIAVGTQCSSAHCVYVSVAQPAPEMRQYLSARAEARRLGLVSLAQMTAAMVDAIEHPPAADDSRLIEVTTNQEIKAAGAA
jgi:hypothetical protein